MSPDDDFVLRRVEERGVRFVRLWFVDVLGLPKSFAIPVSELESALDEGVGIDGSSLAGSARRHELDVVARPDPATFQIVPWRPESDVARMFCDIHEPDGTSFAGDSRRALRRVMDRASQLGYELQVGPEIEFFLFAEPTEGDEPRPLDDGAYFDLTPLDVNSDFRRRTIEYLEQMSISVKASHHEAAASQHELDLLHTDALSMADAIVSFRLAVKEVARELGVHATFMPKPLQRHAGSGMHLHLSLFDGERNAFHPADGERAPLSEVGRGFLAGILRHARELSAVTNQWSNSYRRLLTGFEAPGAVTWSREGDPLVRLPSGRPGKAAATRIELRSPDPGCNAYLALAAVLAAGLAGIEHGYELPAEHGVELNGARSLPGDLREATELLAGSELLRDALGEQILDWYLANKRSDWRDQQATVTELDRRRLLRAL